MLKASNAKPEAWESWQVEIKRRRCGTAGASFKKLSLDHVRINVDPHGVEQALQACGMAPIKMRALAPEVFLTGMIILKLV
jgi:hypothetical protein